MDEWNERVEKWKVSAVGRGMQVEFEYWGAHEILLPLQSDDPKYSGRALFWFNAVVLTKDKLERCVEKQEKTLGGRYTPEFHVDLPIARTLDGLINGDGFWQELNRKALNWNKECLEFFQKQPSSDLSARFELLRDPIETCKQWIDSVVLARDRSQLAELQQETEKATAHLSTFENACRNSAETSKRPNQHSRSYADEVFDFAYRKHSELSAFLNSDFVNANIASAVLVTGEAGAGKSHLLCDFAKGFVKTQGPAILMLGQHYRGGNPLVELLDLLDLNTHSYEAVLGAIDAAGEAAGVNSILLIDAINEGSHRNEWSERIVGLLEDVRRFPHVGVVISCRSRFDDLLIPKSIKSNELLRIFHVGFRGYEHKAAAIYLSGQGIAKPTTPITAPEFSNPLFLKTCATALKQLGETSWPKGYQGTSRLFEIYLSSLEEVVSRRRLTEVNDRLCEKALEAVANEMFPENLFGLRWDNATAIVNAVDTCVNPSESLFQTLLREGALAEDIDYVLNNAGNLIPAPIVRFAYERFCDQFIAQKLLRDIKAPDELFDQDHPLGKEIADHHGLRCRGILAALSIIIPEKFGVEFWGVLPGELRANRQSPEAYFFDSLPYRAPTSFSDQTRELFNSLPIFEHQFLNRRFDLLVQFATEPSHPWNAEQLHKLLAGNSTFVASKSSKFEVTSR
ncbi:MAG: ATP-binding protein, partial [Planctomycetaceae bacterium]